MYGYDLEMFIQTTIQNIEDMLFEMPEPEKSSPTMLVEGRWPNCCLCREGVDMGINFAECVPLYTGLVAIETCRDAWQRHKKRKNYIVARQSAT